MLLLFEDFTGLSFKPFMSLVTSPALDLCGFVVTRNLRRPGTACLHALSAGHLPRSSADGAAMVLCGFVSYFSGLVRTEYVLTPIYGPHATIPPTGAFVPHSFFRETNPLPPGGSLSQGL